MKRLIIAATLLCSLFGSCSDDRGDLVETIDKQPTDGLSLHYSIAPLEAETYSVELDLTETKVNSVYYIFVGSTSNKVMGVHHYENLKLQGAASGVLPFALPDDMDFDVGGYKVKVIVNWDTYLKGGAGSFKTLVDGALMSRAGDINTLTSDLDGLLPLESLSVEGTPLLLIGEFSYQIGSSNGVVELRRRNSVVDVQVELPSNISVDSYSVEGVSTSVGLFSNRPSTGIKTVVSKLSSVSDKGHFRFYALPNYEGAMVLVITGKIVNVISDNTYKDGFDSKVYKDADPQDLTIRIPLVVDKQGVVFLDNQYLSVDIYLDLANRWKWRYSINGWSNQPFKGQYFRFEDSSGVGVSPNNLNFPFADTTPLRIGDEKLPSGKVIDEIYVSTHGVISSWEVELTDGTELPSWLSLTKNQYRSSLIVEAEPNFEVNASGSIVTSQRSFNFNIVVKSLFDATVSHKFPVTIRQEASPKSPTGVALESITVSERYIGAGSANYYANGGQANIPAIGDSNAKGRYLNNSIYGTDYHKEMCQNLYEGSHRLMTAWESVSQVFPHMRFRRIMMNGFPYSMYYLSNGKELTFFNVSGTSQWNTSTFTEIYIYSADMPVGDWYFVPVQYGMVLGDDRTAGSTHTYTRQAQQKYSVARCVKVK